MRKLQTNSNLYNKNTITGMGDSQTDFVTPYINNAQQTWLPKLCGNLNLSGTLTKCRGFGVSGETTTQMLARADQMFMYDTPAIGIIYGGVNDPANSITQATTQANIQAMCKVLKYKAIGAGSGSGCTVAAPSNLPANGKHGQRYVVLADNSTIGGIAAYLDTNHHTTITGDYSGTTPQTVWEFRNAQAGESGWGRVAIASTIAFSDGVSKVIVISTNYQNWTSGGDNYNTNTSTGTQYASYITVRAAALAAAAADSVVYCDLYDFQSKLINGGTFQGRTIISETTQGSNSWHQTANNQHHNSYGHGTVARAVYYTILYAGWLPSLTT